MDVDAPCKCALDIYAHMRAAFCKAGSVSNMFPDGVGTPSGFFPLLWSCWGYLWTGSQGETVLTRVPRFRKPPKIISNFWLCWLFGPWPPAGTEAICSQVQDHDPLLEKGELPPLVGELTHLGLLFKDEGKLDRELDFSSVLGTGLWWRGNWAGRWSFQFTSWSM